jgi:aspartyl-tRNA(Asn)/glutamyl-tRNA(Gln) amidotransferase subunit B
MIQMGMKIEQETRSWDDNSQKTILMRSKEESHDYRYFPDPDLLPLIVTDERVGRIKEIIPMQPLAKKHRFQKEFALTEDESRLLMLNPGYADWFESLTEHYDNARNIANWFFNELLSYVSTGIDDIHITPEDFTTFLTKIDNEVISGKIGKQVLKKSFDTKKGLNKIIEEDKLEQISDHDTIEKMIESVLDANPDKVAEYKNGKQKMFAFFVGQIMKNSQGKANPRMVNEILKNMIDEY